MARDLKTARSARDVFGYLFGPPGWRPDGNGETTEDLRRRAALVADEGDVVPTTAIAN